MTDSKLGELPCSWIRSPWMKTDRKSMETLTSFVRDAEHEMLSVANSLQAQIDLLQREQTESEISVTRFNGLDRAIARLINDTNILGAVSALTILPRSKRKQKLEMLMKEIVSEMKSDFVDSQVALSCEISASVYLSGSKAALKLMFREMVAALLLECQKLETIRITGKIDKKNVSLSFDTGTRNKLCKFEPWQLGELRLVPVNGEGISLAAIDAIARLHKGQLSVKSLPNQRHEYRLSFSG